MNEDEVKLDFVLETDQVAEITSDTEDWEEDGVIRIESEVLAEMVKGDEKPFFVDITALYEGVSGNNREYTKEAVQSCVKAMVGVNMYKGHEEPGTNSWKYREPVGRIVAARASTIDIDGRRVLAAKGKAYITEADAKLRGDIAKKMAGPLSILGNARAVREFGSSQRTITHIHKPLKSIDFCNPGTNGMALAGVTSIVREMSVKDQQEPEQEKTPMTTPKKLNKDELLAEYGPEIRALVSEQMDGQFTELATEKGKLADAQTKFDTDKKELDVTIAEQKTSIDELTTERDTLKTELKDKEQQVLMGQLKEFAATHVAEMKSGDDHAENIVELSAVDLEPVMVEGDLEKSKNVFKDRLAKSVERTEKLAETLGGNPTDADDRTRQHKGNPSKGGNKGPDINKFLSHELTGATKES